ncbi:hypothetical protein [Methylobacterium sp. WL64]|uniref:hypothetical protein n=1 Tax=Methylobacterium sp. WL64 TaxID=2603894 RepID=UPI00165005D7|nr:hypothetical protein [Methylobacterium sp. WL64]
MLKRDTQQKLNAAAAELVRLVEELNRDGDRDGALAASDAADAIMVVLDLDVLRARAGA